MKVKGFDGKETPWKLNLYNQQKPNPSKPHLLCRELLRKIYPNDQILEEVFLPGSNGLYADFYLPLRRLMVEPGGSQHDQYVGHFHNYNKLNFYKSKGRDALKRQWCELNHITLIVLSTAEDIDEWRDKIIKRASS